MNTKQRRSASGAIIRQWMIAFFATAISTVGLTAAEELVRIDFRNKISGLIDAPVFDFDGVSALSTSRFGAQLYVGQDTNSLVPAGDIHGFLTGTNAGYWTHQEPLEVIPIFQPILGQELWFQVSIVEWVPAVPFPKGILVGWGKHHSMVVTNYVMPMVGLESFKLVPEQLHVAGSLEQVIVRWQYLAAARYELQGTRSLMPPVAWEPILEWSGIGENAEILSVTNAVTTAPQFYRLERWRFP